MKGRNFDFALFFWGGGGVNIYLRSDFLEGRVTKILNFALKIKGGGREGGKCEVLRPCHPAPKFGTCTRLHIVYTWCGREHSRSDLVFKLSRLHNDLISECYIAVTV